MVLLWNPNRNWAGDLVLTRELARWIIHGAADISMREFDPRRFWRLRDTKMASNKKHMKTTNFAHEIPFPHFNRLDGRPIKTFSSL